VKPEVDANTPEIETRQGVVKLLLLVHVNAESVTSMMGGVRKTGVEGAENHTDAIMARLPEPD